MKARTSLQKLSGLGNQFLRPLSPEDTYTILVEEVKRLLDMEYGSIFLWIRKKWHRVYTTVPRSHQMEPHIQGFSYTVFKTKNPIILYHDRFVQTHPEAKEMNIQTIIIIPLSYNNESLGVLALQSTKKRKLTKSQKEILKVYSSLATLAIKKTQLYEESKNAIWIRDLFISLAAHELRTPLTTINAYVQLLQRKLRSYNFPELHWLQELSLETNLIIKLVNELLNVDLIRHGSFTYHMEPLPFNNLLARAVEQFSLSFPFHHIKVEGIVPRDKIIGDADKLLQMLSSLFQNAAKFSSPEKDIVLHVQENKTSFSLHLSDSGIGIPKPDLKKVFDGFHKGSNNYQDGIGLGLFLSRQIVEKHKGKITIYSRKKNGTTVIVTLPKIIQ